MTGRKYFVLKVIADFDTKEKANKYKRYLKGKAGTMYPTPRFLIALESWGSVYIDKIPKQKPHTKKEQDRVLADLKMKYANSNEEEQATMRQQILAT